MTITVNPVNDAPVANSDGPYSVNEGGTLTVAAPGVLANDTDIDGPSLMTFFVSDPENASSFTLNADGSFTYVHNGGETTADSFFYRATDGTDFSNITTVTITVNPVNDAPAAIGDGLSLAESSDADTGNLLSDVLFFSSVYTVSDGLGGIWRHRF